MSGSPPHRGTKEILDALYLELSDEDQRESYPALTNTFSGLIYQEDELRLAELFASPLYSDACKRYFAATHIRSEFILLLGDKFLSEEIILNHIETLQPDWERTNYLQIMLGSTNGYIKAIMVSSHLSENIIEAAFARCNKVGRDQILKLAPGSMITPRVINAWLLDVTVGAWGLAALRIREVHPEYEGFPDEWVLKVFCGE